MCLAEKESFCLPSENLFVAEYTEYKCCAGPESIVRPESGTVYPLRRSGPRICRKENARSTSRDAGAGRLFLLHEHRLHEQVVRTKSRTPFHIVLPSGRLPQNFHRACRRKCRNFDFFRARKKSVWNVRSASSALSHLSLLTFQPVFPRSV